MFSCSHNEGLWEEHRRPGSIQLCSEPADRYGIRSRSVLSPKRHLALLSEKPSHAPMHQQGSGPPANGIIDTLP